MSSKFQREKSLKQFKKIIWFVKIVILSKIFLDELKKKFAL